MCHPQEERSSAWDGGFWELRLWYPLERAEQALRAFMFDPRFSGWQRVSNEQPPGMEAVDQVLDLIGNPHEPFTLMFEGLTRLEGAEIPVLLEAEGTIFSRLGHNNPDKWEAVLVRVMLPNGGIEQALSHNADSSVARRVMPFFREAAESIIAQVPVNIAMYCFEMVEDLEESIVERANSLTTPMIGLILRKDHPRANEPGGIPFLQDYVLFEKIPSDSEDWRC